jgi:hypothetical protein
MSAFASNRLIPLNFRHGDRLSSAERPIRSSWNSLNEFIGPHGFLNLNLLPENKGAVFSAEKATDSRF